jgi:hypothetical protein
MSKNKKSHSHKNSYFQQQKVFGDFKNFLEPPFSFAEMVSKITVTPSAPNGIMSELLEFDLHAVVIPKHSKSTPSSNIQTRTHS